MADTRKGVSHLIPFSVLKNAKLLLYISNLSAIPAVWIGRKKRPVIWLYALCSLVFDLNSLILKHFHINWGWCSNLFFLLEFALISLFFIREVFPVRHRTAGFIVSSAASLYFIIHTTLLSIFKANYVDAAILCGIMLSFCFYGLTRVIKEIEFVMIEDNPLFIFCIAILLYASGNFIILLFENKLLLLNEELIKALWKNVHNPLNILKNLLIAYGLLLTNRSKWTH
jgi:hypothetical protein